MSLQGTRLVRESEFAGAGTGISSAADFKGGILTVVLKNVSASQATISDYEIDGVRHAAMPNLVVRSKDTKWWSAWPNPVLTNDLTTLRIRMHDVAATIGANGTSHSLRVYYSGGGSDAFTIAPQTTDLWMPFVAFSQDLKTMTVYAANKGNSTITLPAGGGLTVNGAAVTAAAPTWTLAAGETVPLTVTFAVSPSVGSKVILRLVPTDAAQSTLGSIRALPSTFGSTLWQMASHDATDLARHHFDTSIPGYAVFQDEPLGYGNITPLALGTRIKTAWETNPATPVMCQFTSEEENRIYGDLPDITMTHHQNLEQDISLHMSWPKPVWYLPQSAWGRKESTAPEVRENYYRQEWLRAEAFQALGHGAKHMQWFSHQNQWWQNAVSGGGTDLARTHFDINYAGAVGNPLVWDRIGRVSGAMQATSAWLKNSVPAFRSQNANLIEINTLVNDSPSKAAVILADQNTSSSFYKGASPIAQGVVTFANMTVTARVPAYLSANVTLGYLLDPFSTSATVASVPLTRTGGNATFTLPSFREGAIVLLGTPADQTAIDAAWAAVKANCDTYGDTPVASLSDITPVVSVLPNLWLHRFDPATPTRSVDISADGQKVLLARDKQVSLLGADGTTVLWSQTYPGYVLSAKFSNDGSLVYVSANQANEGVNYTRTSLSCYATATGTRQWERNVGGTIFDLETKYADNGVAYCEFGGNFVRLTSANAVLWTYSTGGGANYAAQIASTPAGDSILRTTIFNIRVDPTGKARFSFREPATSPYETCEEVAISANGARYAAGGSNLYIYDGTNTGTSKVLLATKSVGRSIRKIKISDDGRYVVAGTSDGIVHLYDGNSSWARLWEKKDKSSYVSDLSLLPDGTGVVVAREVFAYTAATLWRFRDVVEAFDWVGTSLWRSEGPWREQPFMTSIALSQTGAKMVSLTNENLRYVSLTASNVLNSSLYSGSLTGGTIDHSLPDGWSNADIASPNALGNADYQELTQSFRIAGAGVNWNTGSDQANFTYKPMTGDGSIIAKISGPSSVNAYTGMGISIRNGTASGAVGMTVFYQPFQNAYRSYTRTAAGGSYGASQMFNPAASSAKWLKIERVGSNFTAYHSTDGIAWAALGAPYTISGMPATANVGLAVMSDSADNLARATFSGVAILGPPVIPSAPTSLAATGLSENIVSLAWTDASDNETAFIIQRCTSTIPTWVDIGAAAANTPSYTDSAASPGIIYSYRVFATNGFGDSAVASNTANVTTVLASPSSVTAAKVSGSRIDLTWAAQAGTTGYALERSTTPNGPWTQIATPAAGATSYSDTTGINADTTYYYYRLRAANSGGNSSYSAAAAPSARPAGVVMPVDINYGEDVETWWARHRYNPSNPNFSANRAMACRPGGYYDVTTSGQRLDTIVAAATAANKTIRLAPGIWVDSRTTVRDHRTIFYSGSDGVTGGITGSTAEFTSSTTSFDAANVVGNVVYFPSLNASWRILSVKAGTNNSTLVINKTGAKTTGSLDTGGNGVIGDSLDIAAAGGLQFQILYSQTGQTDFNKHPGPGLILDKSNVHIICADLNGNPPAPGQKARLIGCVRLYLFEDFDKSYNDRTRINTPSHNYYFKNIVFDGDNDWYAFSVQSVYGTLLDSCEFVNCNTFNRGLHDGNIRTVGNTKGFWMIDCKFNDGCMVACLDGSHDVGYVGCSIGSNFANPSMVFFTNDDNSYDLNGNNLLDPNEQLSTNYGAIVNCSWDPAIPYIHAVVGGHGGNMIFANNYLPVRTDCFMEFNSRWSFKYPGISYQYFNLVARDNILGYAPDTALITCRHNLPGKQPGIDPRMGNVRAYNNIIQTGTMTDAKWYQPVVSVAIGDGTGITHDVEGPVYIWNNTVNGTVVNYTDPAPADTLAPTAPSNLRTTDIGRTGVSLSWDASQEIGSSIYKYIIYRDGYYCGKVLAPQTTFEDGQHPLSTTDAFRNVASLPKPGGNYTYTVKAVDATGINVSEASAGLQVTMLPAAVPGVTISMAQAHDTAEYPEPVPAFNPSGPGSGATATAVKGYFTDTSCGALAKLFDGSLPSSAADTSNAVYNKAGPEDYMFVIDLGELRKVDKINAYSWHNNRRRWQNYTVWSSSSSALPPTSGNLEANGWQFVASVDTSPLGEASMYYKNFSQISGSGIGDARYLAVSLRNFDSNTNYAQGQAICAAFGEFCVFSTPLTAASNPPAAPTGLVANNGAGSSIVLNWVDNASEEKGFKVERSTTGLDGSWSEIGQVAANTVVYTDAGLSPGSTYYYRVKAYNVAGESAYTNSASYMVTTPDAPSFGVGAISNYDNGTILVKWTNNIASNGGAGWVIERSPNGLNGWVVCPADSIGQNYNNIWRQNNPFNNTGTEWCYIDRDATLAGDTSYYYRVRAKTGSTTYTSYSQATPVVVNSKTYPTNFTATPGGKTGLVNLSWTDNCNDEVSMVVERALWNPGTSTPIGNFAVTATLSPNVTSYTDTTATNWGSPYVYRVRADRTGVGSSGPSANAVSGCLPYNFFQSWSSGFDLRNKTIEFRPDAERVMRTLISTNTINSTAGTGWPVSVSNQTIDSVPYPGPTNVTFNMTLTNGKTVSLGTSGAQSVIHHSYGGYLTFDTASNERETTSAFTSAINGIMLIGSEAILGANNYVAKNLASHIQLTDRFVFTYQQVINYNGGDLDCQVEWFFDQNTDGTAGMIRVSFGDKVPTSGNFGLCMKKSIWLNDDMTAYPVACLPPMSISANATNYHTITVNWTNNATQTESGFEVERAPSATGPWTAVGTALARATSFADTTLSAQTQYFFRVRGTNFGNDSGYTLTANATTPPPPPAVPLELAVTSPSGSTATLTWTDVSNEDGFRIMRSRGGNGTWTQIAELTSNTTSYNDTGLIPVQTYSYKVCSFNAAGGASEFCVPVDVVVADGPPLAPVSFSATGQSTASILLSWAVQSANELGFRIERSNSGIDFWQFIFDASAGTSSYIDSSLLSSFTYFYRILAFNVLGTSAYSSVAAGETFTTPPEAPVNLTASSAGSTSQILLAWTDVPSMKSGFRVERSLTGDGSWTQVATPAPNVTVLTDAGLAPRTTYFYRVSAANGQSVSGFSNISSATTGDIPPNAPTGLVLASSVPSRVSLTWADNSDNESLFQIDRSSNNSTWTSVASVGAGATAFTDAGLAGNSLYYYRLRAVNSIGSSSYLYGSTITAASEPNLIVNGSFDSSVSNWTSRAWLVQDTTTKRTGAGAASVGNGTGTYTAGDYIPVNSPLTPNTDYQLDGWVKLGSGNFTATSVQLKMALAVASGSNATSSLDIANSGWQKISTTFKTGATVSGPKLTLSTTFGNGTVWIDDVSLRKVSDSSELVINPGFEADATNWTTAGGITLSRDTGDKHSGTASGTLTLTGATGTKTSDITCRYGTPLETNTQYTLEGWVLGNGTITGTGIQLAILNMSGGTGSTTTANSGSPGTWTRINADFTTGADITNVPLSTAIRIVNSISAGNVWLDDVSLRKTGNTTVTVPPAPGVLVATADSSSGISLTWTDNSTTETGFRIERGTALAGPFTEVALAPASTVAFADAGLAAGTTYYYRVCAYNAGGNSAYTTVASASTLSSAVPPAPTGFSATSNSTTSISLAWTDASPNETGFRIERGSSAGGPFTLIAIAPGNSTSFTNSSLAPGSTYFYRICAANAAGNSAFAAVASATTGEANVPTAPTGLLATAQSTSSITLTWTDTSTNESGFRIERATSANGTYWQVALTPPDVTTLSDTGLAAGTTYYYRICSGNADGNSAYTPVAQAATLIVTVPPSPTGLGATATSSTAISLAWTDASTNEDGFRVERATGASGPFTTLAVLAAGTVAYADSALSPVTTYYYRVCSFNAAGSSAYASAQGTTQAVPLPAAPTGLSANGTSQTAIRLDWTDQSSDETGFKIERAADVAGPWTSVTTTSANALSYSDSGLTTATTYYYRIAATRSGIDSAFTSAVAGTTQADTTPPTLVSAVPTSAIQVLVTFSEEVGTATANVAANYGISGNITVSAASRQTNTATVLLTVSSMPTGSYTLTVTGVRDAYNNVIAGSNTAAFNYIAVPSAGMMLWLKGDAGITGSTTVSGWTSQGGNATTANQTLAASQPTLVANAINGKPVVRFDGVDDSLAFSGLTVNGLTGMTIFLVSATNNSTQMPVAGDSTSAYRSAIFWDELPAGWGTIFLSPYQTNVRYRFGTGQIQTSALPDFSRPTSIGGNFSITTAIHNSGNETLYVNGASVYSQTGKTAAIARCKDTGFLGRGYGTTLTANATTCFAGDIAEIIVYNRALNATERQDVDAYLTAKYFYTAPTIASQPEAATVFAGGNATFSVTANGTPAPTYQWRKNGTNISGATSASLALTNVQSSDQATYSVVVSNSVGSIASIGAALTVLPSTAPAITTQPASASLAIGGNVTFTVAATGTPAPTYQWRKNGSDISGATSPALTITDAQLAASGNYTVFVSNPAGSVTSDTAVLAVSSPDPFATWAAAHSIAVNSAGADPDGDGRTNLLEYALGSNPSVAEAAGLASQVQSGFLQISLSMDSAKTDLTYTVEATSNLATWTPIAQSSGGGAMGAIGGLATVTDAGTGARTVTVRDTQALDSHPRRFLRLKVSKP